MKDTSDRIIFVALGVAVLFGLLSFFKFPLYEKGAWAVIGLVVLIVTNVMSFKFGVHVARLPVDGGDSTTHTISDTTKTTGTGAPPIGAVPNAQEGK